MRLQLLQSSTDGKILLIEKINKWLLLIPKRIDDVLDMQGKMIEW